MSYREAGAYPGCLSLPLKFQNRKIVHEKAVGGNRWFVSEHTSDFFENIWRLFHGKIQRKKINPIMSYNLNINES